MARVDKSEWPRLRPTKYRKVQGKDGTWYLPVEGINSAAEQCVYVQAADGVHVDTHNPNSRGYGGSVLKFTLEDGTIDEVKGPWHSSSFGLFSDTGINVSDLHLTQVTIGTEPGKFMEVMGDIIYQEDKPVLGPFMRGERIAQQLADLLNKPLYRVTESSGGGSAAMHYPGRETHPMARRKDD